MSGEDFMNEDLVKTKVTYKHLFKRMWPYARRHRMMLFSVILSIVLLAIISRMTPNLIGYAIDKGLKEKNKEVFIRIAYIYLALEVLKTILHFCYAYFFQIFGNRVLYYMREDIMRHVQNLPLQFFNKTPTGRVVTRITNDVVSLGDLFTDGIITVFVQFVIMLAILVSMLFISPKLTLITLLSAPVFIGASFWLSNRIRVILSEQKKKLSAINAFLAENLNGIKVVQLYNRVFRHQVRFAQLSDDYRALNMKSIRAYSLMQPIMNLFNAVTITSALYFGGWLHESGSLAIGSLVAFLMHAQDFIPPLREILEKYQQFQNSLASAERIFTLMDEGEEKEIQDIRSVPSLHGDLRIENLSFRYEDSLPLVLKNIQLSITRGESIALVGRTGSGKSTFISLLQRFYDAPERTIFIDGLPIEQIPRHEIRKHVGVVQQDNFIFRGTLRDNINLGDTTISDESIQKACVQIGYDQLLRRLGRNLDSPIEERGANLSVGERQLIAFARILTFDPDILILDEATANIDSESEILIQNATHEITKDRTSILIAHRLSTIQKCDRIIVLKEGEIQESGSHEVLMKAKGYYYQLAAAGVKLTTIAASAGGIAVP